VTNVDCFAKDDCDRQTRWLYKHNAYFVWTPDSHLALAPQGTVDYRYMRIYDVTTGEIVRSLQIPDPSVAVDSFAWSRSGDWVAVGQMIGQAGNLFLVPAKSGKSKPMLLTDTCSYVVFWLTIP